MKLNADVVQLARLVLKRYQATIEEATRPSGLNPLEGLLVTFLCNNPDKDTPAEAVRYLHLSKGNVSSAVLSLERQGYLERRNDPLDHRKCHLSLTAKAQPLCETIQKARKKFFDQLFAGLSPEACRDLSNDADILLRNMDHDKE
jgi:DNA-binding MarR family transcriptional regulator